MVVAQLTRIMYMLIFLDSFESLEDFERKIENGFFKKKDQEIHNAKNQEN